MEAENMTELRAFFTKMREDAAFQDGFRQHMGSAMRTMDADIGIMQKSMNSKISEGFLAYAREAGFNVTDDAMDALLKTVNEGLHQKMGAIFQQEFAKAIAQLMQ